MAAPAVPLPDEKPLLVKSWWERLGNGERLGLLAAVPERIGGLDGIPIEVRDRANRADLGMIIAAAEAKESAVAGKPLPPVLSQVAERVLRIIDDRSALARLRTLRDRIDRPSPVMGIGYHLIGFDAAGEGKTVVSLGNPDESDHVAVFVPKVPDDDPDDGARTDAIAVDAAIRDGARRTAVVRWLSYGAPDGMAPGPVSTRFADEAAPDLYRFVAGLRVTRDGRRSRITMIGHSYGSTVIGITDRDHRLAVDAMVFVAAPGVGVDRADKLSVGADRVWVTLAPGDRVDEAWPRPLGIAPTRPEFGAEVFTCANTGRQLRWLSVFGVPRDPVKAHNGYWNPGNVARDNIAAIVTGDVKAVELKGER